MRQKVLQNSIDIEEKFLKKYVLESVTIIFK